MGTKWRYSLVGAVLVGLGGWWAGTLIGDTSNNPGFIPWGLGGLLLGTASGLILPHLILPPIARLGRAFENITFSALVSGTVGMMVGLTVAVLLSFAFARLPGWPGVAVPIVLSVVLGPLGLVIMVSREREVSQLLPEHSRRSEVVGRNNINGRVLMDTSAIIDGRIADISKTGFVHGTMIIPRFILDELRHVADSSDALRRNRGRRGLEILNKLRREAEVPIQILDVDAPEDPEVDAKLVTLAKNLKANILTTDFNLDRVAELQGVRVLNINELANALKPVVLPGEEMVVLIIQEGKEFGQGVGFLDDGTMVVVEGGKRHINSHLDVSVTRVLQTAAGRIIFAQTLES
ncbi:MAG: PIN domain nuclease [Dehalococcoidia bacterium]|nr:PIN domain nuclease [Dehalococcoidia bacterium]